MQPGLASCMTSRGGDEGRLDKDSHYLQNTQPISLISAKCLIDVT